MTKAITTKQDLTLQEMVDSETSNRKILTEFINKHMVRGTDFGSIMFGGRQSKDCLFKPGAEKIGSLLRLRPDVIKDNDTWEMAGSKAGLFCYRCNLYNSKNEIVGMGLGACSLEEKKNYNNAIKIAKKRAYVDAILTTGALSDFFTQDLEDASDTDIADTPVSPAKTQYTPSQAPQERLITAQQRYMIFALLTEKGFSKDHLDKYIETKFEKDSLTKLTIDEATIVIKKIKTLETKLEEDPESEKLADEVDAGLQATQANFSMK